MKDLIIQKAFVLFLNKGFNGTSISHIQTAVNTSRGAIYHYFKSKEDIYREVVDRYLITALSVVTKISEEDKTTLYDTIIYAIKERRKIIDDIKSITTEPLSDFYYFKLVYDACDFYKGFVEKINLINHRELSEWKSIIAISIANKEIKNDLNIDFIANNFVLLPQSVGLKYSFNGTLNIDELEMMYFEFYKLLKS
ncbi:hypothetical protein HW49_03595 [Porphyromonadaceae bacterium COT-184 OH4590]|nr:hypothetical protein HW49_03595 [Porphyromonadaceae bacterium COT-184 OH4590]MDO4726688.1 TetR/AcrR family transcriptional regulator [Porphyromonadaceae bacterium]